jgi:hypothetical protein
MITLIWFLMEGVRKKEQVTRLRTQCCFGKGNKESCLINTVNIMNSWITEPTAKQEHALYNNELHTPAQFVRI